MRMFCSEPEPNKRRSFTDYLKKLRIFETQKEEEKEQEQEAQPEEEQMPEEPIETAPPVEPEMTEEVQEITAQQLFPLEFFVDFASSD